MSVRDTLGFATRAATGYPVRTGLMMLAMAIGVAAVVLLTALGDGARRYVVDQFNALGSSLIIVLPGRTETGGVGAGSFSTSASRDLTTGDAAALRRASSVTRTAPLLLGNSEVAWGGKLRETLIVGTSAEFLGIRNLKMAQGQFLPVEDLDRATPVAVIGAEMREQLFGAEPALGKMIRVADRRYRVIGVLAASGSGLGMTADELVIIPVGAAQALFNTSALFRVFVEARNRDAVAGAKKEVLKILKARHGGEEDVTLITQDAVLGTFDRILGALTLAVGGIAAISLAVAGILVMNVMLVAVTQRTSEIGLLKALGATAPNIRYVFLAEAALLSIAGALCGLALGHVGAWGLRQAFPDLPAYPPDWAMLAGLGTAITTGLLFGVMPARRAASMDPVDALAKR
ncbi:ABC transporter permease [Nitrogeniibacter aestuarii]|uniref:ABC transporter permease n=1 Tax=Nitrogeniibacter aestuarii TaxID=2815343 RepID=UPI001D12C29C|nr:ABC transporter permease [Nitrogeniibacter aestuarii]